MFIDFIFPMLVLPLVISCNEGYSNQTEQSELKYFEMCEENKTAIFEWSDTKKEMIPLQQEDDECIYRGSFKEDPSSRVLVTGCEWEDRSIQIHSVLYGDTLATSVNGSVELLQEHGNLLMNDMVENDEFLQQVHQEQLGKRIKREYVINPDFRKQFPISNNANRNLIMPKLLDLPINIYLAPSWRSKFSGLSGGKSKAKEILSHVKLWFLHPSLDTKINIIYLDSNIFSTSADLIPTKAHLKSLGNFVSPPPSGHAAIVYLTATTAGSTAGLSYINTICDSNKKMPRSISGWHDSDIHTAQTVAHEIGHNLGYYHDFDTTTLTGRNKPCGPGQWNNGPDNDLMNYASNSVLRQNKWSDCTNEDFRNYFAQVTSKSGSSFCLEVSKWEQTKSDDCWSDCGKKGGPCPSFCGSNGYCCRKGWDGCPPGAGEASPIMHPIMHTCVREIASSVWSKGLRYFKATIGSGTWDGTDDDVSLKLSGGVNGQTCKTGVLWEGYWYNSWSSGDVEEYKATNQDFGDCGDFVADGSPIGFTIVKPGNGGLKLVKMEFDIGGKIYVWSGAAWWDPTHPVLLANCSGCP